MSLSRRYSPEWASGDAAMVGMDWSALIPPGVGISAGSLIIQRNTNPPTVSVGDFTTGPVGVTGRATYARLAGGVSGTDYRLVWTANDTDGNVWNRTALMLCAPTS